MCSRLSVIRPILAFFSLLLICGANGLAQSSLFSIPTTDVLERGSTYIEADFDTNLFRPTADRWHSFGSMFVRGLGKRSEVGLNVYAARTPEGFEPLELQPNFKFNIYKNESNGFALSAGAIGYLPLSHKFRSESVVSVYAVASKTFAKSWTPRITGGGYQLFGRNTDNSGTRGFLIGIEQPVTKRLNFIADWNTAKNRFGYAAVGLGFSVTKRSSIYSAYYFGNSGRGNNSLGIYYGLSF